MGTTQSHWRKLGGTTEGCLNCFELPAKIRRRKDQSKRLYVLREGKDLDWCTAEVDSENVAQLQKTECKPGADITATRFSLLGAQDQPRVLAVIFYLGSVFHV